MGIIEFRESAEAFAGETVGEQMHGDRPWRIAYVPSGMLGGEPAVEIGFQRIDGDWVVCRNSLAGFLTVAALLSATADRRGDTERFDLPQLSHER